MEYYLKILTTIIKIVLVVKVNKNGRRKLINYLRSFNEIQRLNANCFEKVNLNQRL